MTSDHATTLETYKNVSDFSTSTFSNTEPFNSNPRLRKRFLNFWLEPRNLLRCFSLVSIFSIYSSKEKNEYKITISTCNLYAIGPCNENAATDQECETVLHDLENIDDDLDDFGIKLVTTEDIKYAGQVLKIRRIPSLGIFRNGQFKLYEGPLNDESELLSWLVDTDTLDLPGTIEKVTGIFLTNIE